MGDEIPLRGTKITVGGISLSEEHSKSPWSRTGWEALGWVLLVSLLWGSDLLVKLSGHDPSVAGRDTFKLVSEQVTSAIAALIMVMFIVQWLKLFPISRDAWPRTIIGHTIGSIIFAFGHFALMVALREPWYALNDRSYIWREPFAANLILEYQKDIKIYIGFVVLIAAYQYFRDGKEEPARPETDRLLVQTGTGDAVLRFAQIDYLEAARNYIAIHAEGREYVIRDTMANVERRLAGGPFARTHRSFIVNIDKVQEIRAVDSKQRVFLHGGADIPLSRSHRDQFSREILGQQRS